VPGLLKRILAEERWRMRVIQQSGEIVEFNSFTEFVTTPPLEGLGANMDLIRRICRGDTETVDLLDAAVKGQQGKRTDLVYNIHEVTERPSGTSLSSALRRLRKERPDLHQRVLSDNEFSANAAMVEAGFRTKTITIPIDPKRAAKSIKKHFSEDQIEDLVGELSYER
jgi:hypothetical protein